jgi:hypothetical protein
MSTNEVLTEETGLAGVAAAILLLLALAWAATRPPQLPQPMAADAPAAQFSAARAFAHVEQLAQAPRPIASDANRAARQYLVERVRRLGLEPEVQRATVQKQRVDRDNNVEVILGVVHNVVAVLPGTAPDHAQRPALLLASHYDTGKGTLGAADGGAPVAAMLETLRALRAGAPLANDVVFLFADGEHVSALGTKAFVDEHPLARRIGLALRFDGAGNRGPLVLYNTHGADSDTIHGWYASGPGMYGSSLMRYVDQLTPKAISIGPLAQLKAPVLHFANTAGSLGRHGALDTPARLDRMTLQHTGDTMIQLARHFGQQRLPGDTGAAPDPVYFSLPAIGMVHYAGDSVWPFTRVACLLFVGVCCLSVQRARVGVIGLIQGTCGFALIACAIAAGAWTLWLQVPALRQAWNPAAPEGAQSGRWFLFGVIALGTALFIHFQRRLQREAGTSAAVLGALLCIAIALVTLSWSMPGASYLLVWPLFAALAAFAALHFPALAARSPATRLLVLLAGVAPAVILIAPAVRDAFLAMSPHRMNLPVALLALLLGLGVAPLASMARRYVVRGLALAGLGCLALASSADPYVEEPLQANRLVYYKDTTTWKSYWLLPPVELDGWTRQIFRDLNEPHVFVDVFGWDSQERWYAPAPRTELKLPQVVMLKNEEEPMRYAEFELTSKNRAPQIEMWIKNGRPLRTTVNGRVLTSEESRTWALSMYGMEDRPLHFRMEMKGSPSFRVHVEEHLPGLPQQGLPPMPPELARTLLPMTGTTIAADTLLFR